MSQAILSRSHDDASVDSLPPPDSPSTSDLISKPDTPAVDRDALYDELAPLIRRLIRQYGWSAELREDLVGEIYFRYCHLIDVFDATRGIPLKAYLIRQLTAFVFTYTRQARRISMRQIELDIPANEEILASLVVDPTGEWDDNLVLAEFRGRLPMIIEKLPPRQGVVVQRKYLENRDYPAIAEELEIEQSTVRSLLRHAIRNLRLLLNDSIIEAVA